jgi:predicted O-methyltransferase YrrM
MQNDPRPCLPNPNVKRLYISTYLLGWAFILFAATALVGLPTKFSQTIDLSNLTDWHLESYCQKHLFPSAFNGAPEIGAFHLLLEKDFQIEAAVETGTYNGLTTQFLSSGFKEVHTIEIVEESFLKSKEFLKNCTNVHCYLGSSEQILHKILPTLKDKRTIFYLDAHWNKYWPLLDELEEIGNTHRDNCIIVIDDFKVPHRKDIPYDQYESHSCSYKYIKKKLDKIYSQYDFYYLIPKNLSARAKFVAIPRKWARPKDSICKSKFDIASQFFKQFKL